MFDFDFEDIRNDVGQELKDTAEGMYQKAVTIVFILGVIELIGGLILAINVESFAIFLYAVIALVIEALIIMAAARLWAMQLYAKGEQIHLLRTLTQQGGVPAAPVGFVPTQPAAQPKAPAQAAPVYAYPSQPAPTYTYTYPSQPAQPAPSQEENVWFCSHCGTKNKAEYGMCKKCATYRSAK